MTSQGMSLHIGLNAVDPAHYDNWSGNLIACENDARDMTALARTQSFATTTLLTSGATAGRVLRAIRDATAVLRAGDVFLITFAGHGAQIPDQNGDEPDRKDETWLLHDRMLVDDELNIALSAFREGVRTVVISDSCTSGSSSRTRSRSVPDVVITHTLEDNKALYQEIQRATRSSAVTVQPDVLLLSACQDGEVAADGDLNGLFTEHLKAVWNSGRFTGTYTSFWREISRRMPDTQNPNLLVTGPNRRTFQTERPFSITKNKKEKAMTATYTDVNDNWADVQLELLKRVPLDELDGDGDGVLPGRPEQMRGPVLLAGPSAPTRDDVPDVATRGDGVTVRAFWWGFHVQLDHESLTEVLDSADVVNTLVGLIGGSIPSPAQPWIVVIAKFVSGAHALLRTLDHGNGIYISMSWFAPGIFVPTPVPNGRGAGRAVTQGEPLVEDDFVVNESDEDVDTGIYVQPGQRVTITASGEIWAGVALTGNNGPQGWLGWKASNDSPLPNKPPFSLLARLGGQTRYVGTGKSWSHRGNPGKLFLRINDNRAGNGSGAFDVHVEVYEA